MFRTSTATFDKLLDKATSHLLMEADYSAILQICDLIRQNDIQPKYVFGTLKKKLSNPNPYSAMYSLLVLESVVKNCGAAVLEELTTKQFCDFLHEIVKTTTHDDVRQKLLELIQMWSSAFRKNPKHGALKDLMTVMKSEGYKFPVLRESDAMYTANIAPDWADGEVCHRCRIAFGVLQRKHHCRACGQVFCHQCSSKVAALPKYGIEKEVRVCDNCYEEANKPLSAPKGQSKPESDLPAEYINSSLAHQSQEPSRKSEDELREEEELQLAIAISQSEAEAKEKEKLKFTSSVHNTFKAPEPVARTATPPQEEQPNSELARYLNRSYWESKKEPAKSTETIRPTSPSAPVPKIEDTKLKIHSENGVLDTDMEEFIKTLRGQLEIFINRMKSNCSRGRSIANDSSVQSLFLAITNMHSKLLIYIREHDDSRLHYERLQDKLTQVKDARAALDALRDEYREKLRREAEEAERQRQLQMAHKLEIMRKKKQEYLQYQRQLALQRIQEQEREMQMRQEQQKQQYIMGPHYGTYPGSPVHMQTYPGNSGPPNSYYQYPMGQPMAGQQPPQPAPQQIGGPPGIPSSIHHGQPMGPGAVPPGFQQIHSTLPNHPQNNTGQYQSPPQMTPSGMVVQNPPPPGVMGHNPTIQQPPQNMIPPQGQAMHQQFAQAPPESPRQGENTQTAELISFD